MRPTLEVNFTGVIGGPYSLPTDIAKVFDQDNQKNSEIFWPSEIDQRPAE